MGNKKGMKLHAVADKLGHLLTLSVTPGSEQERAQVEELATETQALTGATVELVLVDQVYTGEEPATKAAERGTALEVIMLSEAKKDFVLAQPHSMLHHFYHFVHVRG